MRIRTGLLLLAALALGWWLGVKQGVNTAEAKIEIADVVAVMEEGDKTYSFDVVPTQGNGRRIFCEGIALGPLWSQSEGLDRSSRLVVFPETHSGSITITISHTKESGL